MTFRRLLAMCVGWALVFVLAGAPAFGAAPKKDFILHVSSHRTIEEADWTMNFLREKGQDAFSRYEAAGNQGMWHRVYVGFWATKAEAEAAGKKLQTSGAIDWFQAVKDDKGIKPGSGPPALVDTKRYLPDTSFKKVVYGRYVASFRYKHIAEAEAEGLTRAGWPASVEQEEVQGEKWFRVYMVPPHRENRKMEPGGLAAAGKGIPGFSVMADMSGTGRVFWTPETSEKPEGLAEASRCPGYSKRGAKLALLRKFNENVPNANFLSALRRLGHKPAQGPTDISPIFQRLGLDSGHKSEYTWLTFGLTEYDRKWFGWAVDRLEPSGAVAPLGEGIQASNFELAAIKGRKALIIVSDFNHGMGFPDPVARARELKKIHGAQLCIYTIYMDADEKGMERARSVALEGGCGNFYDGCRLLTEDGYFRQMIAEIFYGQTVQMAGAVGCPDSDGDAVCDGQDKCPNTPSGALVDERGCWLAALGPFFDFNKAVLKDKFKPGIAWAADILKQNPAIRVRVDGHTDSVGGERYNLNLGRRRAEAVRNALIGMGVAPSRMVIQSYGEAKPAVDNKTDQGRAQNRRVELHVIK